MADEFCKAPKKLFFAIWFLLHQFIDHFPRIGKNSVSVFLMELKLQFFCHRLLSESVVICTYSIWSLQ
jgi:hypothetical protein